MLYNENHPELKEDEEFVQNMQDADFEKLLNEKPHLAFSWRKGSTAYSNLGEVATTPGLVPVFRIVYKDQE